MNESMHAVQIEHVALSQIADRLACFPALAKASLGISLANQQVDLIHAAAGAQLIEAGESPLYYAIVLEGQLRADRPEQDGTITVAGYASPGEGSGETPLMQGKVSAAFNIVANHDTVFIRFTREQFW